MGETLLFVLLLLFATIAVIAFAAKRPRHGYLATGWLWYVGMLVPVLGIIQVGLQARADRYTYLPQIGLFMATTWGIAELSTSWPARRQILSVLALSLIAILSWCARIQASYWHDSVSLWRHALAVTGENALAETSLADALIARGEIDEAIAHAQSAVRLQPDSPDAQNNLGIALSRKGNLREAIAHLQQAAERSPDRPKIHYNLATILLQNGEIDEAIAQYRLELRTQPRSAEAHNNLGIAFSQKGDVREAITEWRRTLQTQPENLDAHCNLAWVFSTYPEASIRNGQEAVELAQRALKLSGGKNPRIFRLLAAGYAEMGKFPEAVDAANRGLQLAMEQGNAHLANVLRENINQFRANSPLRDRGN